MFAIGLSGCVASEELRLSAGNRFKVAITGDFRDGDGEIRFDDAAMETLTKCAELDITVLETDVGQPVGVDALGAFDALIMKRSPLTVERLACADIRIGHIARNGAGTEHIALDACTAAGIVVTNTPESVRRPMASGAVALLLNLAHALKRKDATLRADGWDGRFCHRGTGLTERTLGLVGCGNIGSDILALTVPWDMERIVCAPSKSDEEIGALGATRVDLDAVLARSDFLVLCCPLTDATAKMINAGTLSRMKPGSFLINIGRGGLVDEADLIEALSSGHLAGAGIDVFDPEPPARDNPLLAMPNVIATAHNIGLSDESVRLGNASAAAAVVAFATGRIPENIVNPAVLDHPRVRRRFAAERRETP